jgi:hypothetical protein
VWGREGYIASRSSWWVEAATRGDGSYEQGDGTMQLLARTCEYDRMNFQRLGARVFVAAGGAFWAVAAFGADFAYKDQSIEVAVGNAFVPLAIAVLALAVGWYYEVLVAAILLAGTIAVIAWGVVAQWEAGVWVIVAFVLIAPMVIAAVLFLLAARMQNICTLEEHAG